MTQKPNLIIQRQRMGDLILSFPLFSWLAQAEPEHPVWVVAEPSFYEALVPLAPSVIFFDPGAETGLRDVEFRRVINLSHRPETARFAGRLKADEHFGAVRAKKAHRILGSWHLYRASLVHNNRHNLFHWADLNALDCVDPVLMLRSAWPLPRGPKGSGRIGLFVGASEKAKRPPPKFWGELARELGQRGFKPVFLGGRQEWWIGDRAARIAGMPRGNLCGNFSLPELAFFLSELDLLITPDTGPMHVGAWGGTLTLNLSMGPVNAWETAPFPPGHLVLRPSSSCTGCWQCFRDDPPCRGRFLPSRVASLVHGLFKAGSGRPPALPGLQFLRTRRTEQGLFQLDPVTGALESGREAFFSEPYAEASEKWEYGPAAARYALGDFWRQWFLARLGGPAAALAGATETLRRAHPLQEGILRRGLPRVQSALTLALRKKSLPSDFWLKAPPVLRPLTGFLQMSLENADFRREAWLETAEHLEHLSSCL